MHAVIRTYTTTPTVVAEVRAKAAGIEQTMRQTPGFVAYYLFDTADGLATVTVTEDAAGSTESMGRAASWVKQNMPNGMLGAPAVTQGQMLISATR